MSRRTALPGADELFRSTGDPSRATGDPTRGVAGPAGPDDARQEPATVGRTADRTQPGAADRTDRHQDSRVNGQGDSRRSSASQPLNATAPTGGPTVMSSSAAAQGPVLAPVSLEDTEGLDEAADAVRSTSRRRPRAVAERRPSGRERHDEKITVYVSADELMDLEHARLMLRGDHGLPVDRGRVVREALAVVLADFEAKGEASILVRRLRGR